MNNKIADIPLKGEYIELFYAISYFCTEPPHQALSSVAVTLLGAVHSESPRAKPTPPGYSTVGVTPSGAHTEMKNCLLLSNRAVRRPIWSIMMNPFALKWGEGT